MNARSLIDELTESGPRFDTLKKAKVPLEKEERAKAMKAGTHRCFQSKSTLSAAIKAFHDVVEPSS